ncbi:MAG TPA: YeaH/YhbH family protein, partial [Bradyrhizobium sp.]
IRRAGYATSGSPANISVGRTVRMAMARRVALRRPRPEQIAELEAEAANSDEARRAELMAEIDALKAKLRRIPFIDPIDIRYRRFETTPKPVAQAVMFCLMDVSGSMTEHMKDLAKRFYMLLYVFLKRRYRHVEIVFIRHTDRAEEVDEETFFHGPASGGTLVSSALQAMHDIVRSRFRPADWNIYAAQASDGDNSSSDGEVAGRLLTEMILPVSQFFAYLEVGESGGHTFDLSDSSLWSLYQRLRADGAPLSMRKVSDRSEIFPVFHDLFHRRGKQERAAP